MSETLMKTDNRVEYFNDEGKLDRVDGPAVEWVNGREEWYRNGRLHRVDGPAIVWGTLGRKEWYLNGVRHREDGPAVERANGQVEFWVDGTRVG